MDDTIQLAVEAPPGFELRRCGPCIHVRWALGEVKNRSNVGVLERDICTKRNAPRSVVAAYTVEHGAADAVTINGKDARNISHQANEIYRTLGAREIEQPSQICDDTANKVVMEVNEYSHCIVPRAARDRERPSAKGCRMSGP